MNSLFKPLCSAFVAMAAFAGAASAQTTLTVYTALENDQLAPLKTAFEADNPGITIEWVRDSTGVITAKLLAEKANPRADVVWGLAASSLMILGNEGMLAEYAPSAAAALKPAFKPAGAPAIWHGFDAFLGFVCVNKPELDKRGAKMPTVWNDLTDPKLAGSIVMPNPASSGTGYLMVAAWLQTMGEEKGWAFMDALHQNIGAYTHSGSAPCSLAARGERTIGLGLDMRGVSERNKGAPLELVLPTDGIGWDMEAVGIVKATDAMDAAKKLVDWSLSDKAFAEYGKVFAVLGKTGAVSTAKNYPAEAEARMTKNDFGWMAKNRERVLAEWTKRYDGKSEPKKQ